MCRSNDNIHCRFFPTSKNEHVINYTQDDCCRHCQPRADDARLSASTTVAINSQQKKTCVTEDMFTFVKWYHLCQVVIIAAASLSATCNERIDLYKIEGRVVFSPGDDDIHNVRILVDEGQYVGIPRIDGTFVIAGVPSGSYVVSVDAPFHVFKPARVDINSKGKIRAREVDYIQPSRVVAMKYPLHFDALEKKSYFEKHEKIRWTDFLMNPVLQFMVIGIPLLIILTKTMPQGEEMEQTMQQANNFLQPNVQLPDLAAWFADWFGGPRRLRPLNAQPRAENRTAPPRLENQTASPSTEPKTKTNPKRTRNRKQ